MQALEIIMKSGVVIKVEADKWSIQKNVDENTIERFTAESCTPHLPYINLAEVAAIVAK